MKRILVTFCIVLCSYPALATNEVVALMKFHQTEKGKMFSAHWFESRELGLINMGLSWARYNSDVQEGFKLGEAKAIRFISPKLPGGCVTESFNGDLNWIESGVSAVSATLSGSSCKAFLNKIAKTPIEIIFLGVPHLNGTTGVETLLLKIVDTP